MAMCRGVRGATTAAANEREAILEATKELLTRLVERNQVAPDDIAAIFFTVSDDLDAEYPALAARLLGWNEAALMCAREIPVSTTVAPRCIRVLMLINTEKSASQIAHIYLREAVALRPSRADISVESATPDAYLAADSDATKSHDA
jgi:monofunctional chorismate mutase